MTVMVHILRNGSLEGTIDHENWNVTSYRASTPDAVSLMSEAHLQMLQDKLAELTGQPYTREEFLAAMTITDTRPPEE